MHRTQLYLDEFHYRALRETAQREKKSLAQLVREIIDRHLSRRHAARDPFLKAIGSIRGGPDNISERHKDYLYGKPGPKS